ncbi:MAG: hypothetical protein IJI15_06725 [Atopobiaceae bacterium]|nr:hypothetical protein [Atopobiaceae bacterium]
MQDIPLFAMVGPAWMLIQITLPVLALAAKLPRRGLPRVIEGIVPIVLLFPVWLFLTSRWRYFAPTDVPGTLVTFAIVLALLFATVMTIHRASTWSALFCASAGYTIQNIASSTSTLNSNIAELMGIHDAYLENVLICEQATLVVIYALAFLLFVSRIWKKRLELVEDRRMVLAFVICLFAVIGFDVLIKGAATEGLSLELCCSLRVIHLAFCVFLLYFDYRTLSRNRIEAEAAVNRHIIAEREHQYEESRLTIDAVNQRMHDICHSVAERAVEMGATGDPRVDELISQVLDEVRHYDTVISTGDEPLDTVLTEKGLVCEREGMRLSPVADGSALSRLEPAEKYALVGGVIDTAIELVRHVEDPALRDISLTIRKRGDMAVVSLEHYLSEKHAAAHLGRTAELIIERYDGAAIDRAEDGIRTLTVTLPV